MKSKTPEQIVDWFVGQVIKRTEGRANPKITKELVIKTLNKPTIINDIVKCLQPNIPTKN